MSGVEQGVRVLVTGATGFVGRHAVRMLHDAIPHATILASRPPGRAPLAGGACEEAELDVVDYKATQRALKEFQPTHVLHLAAVASIRMAMEDQQSAWRTNVDGSLNVARAVAESLTECRLVFVSSSEVYGAASSPNQPVGEDAKLEPLSFYGLTKAVVDMAIGQMARGGLRAVRLRPFNHTGAGQSVDYVLPSFAHQIVAIERGLQPPVLKVGNLSAVRDFLDVRDVVQAYIRAIQIFDRLPPATVLNVASGVPVGIGELLTRLLAIANLDQEVEIVTEAYRHRPDDVQARVGDATRVRELLGWRPCHSLNETLSWVLEAARGRPGLDVSCL